MAHTRCNLALVDGLATAERFLQVYVQANPGYVHDPWWDAVELLPWDDDFSGVMAFNTFGAGLDLGRLGRGRTASHGSCPRRPTAPPDRHERSNAHVPRQARTAPSAWHRGAAPSPAGP